MSQFQYCDLKYGPVRAILEDPQNIKSTCDRREGWFVDGVINQVRGIIKNRWLELVKAADAHFYGQAQAMVMTPPSTQQFTPSEKASGPKGDSLSYLTQERPSNFERPAEQDDSKMDDVDAGLPANVEEHSDYELYD